MSVLQYKWRRGRAIEEMMEYEDVCVCAHACWWGSFTLYGDSCKLCVVRETSQPDEMLIMDYCLIVKIQHTPVEGLPDLMKS